MLKRSKSARGRNSADASRSAMASYARSALSPLRTSIPHGPGRSQPLQRRSAGIGQAQGLGDLVERFARGVVDRRAEPAAGADASHVQQLAVPARDQQQQERIGDVGGQSR